MQDQALRRLVGVTLAVQLIFAIAPQIDIQVARLFLQPDGSFWLASNRFAAVLRALAWFSSLLVAGLAAVFLAASLCLRARAEISWRFWAFVTTLYVIGPGVLVNGVLKEYWGRARPADIIAFGGGSHFTPPFEIAQECLSNCSFVSGEVAAATVLAIVIGTAVLSPGQVFRFGLWQFGLFAITLGVAFQRMASGRHFLSDALFAALFMLIVARILHRALRVPAPKTIGFLAAAQADVAMTLQLGHAVVARGWALIWQAVVKAPMALLPRIIARFSLR